MLGIPKTTLTGGPGRPCSPVKPRWPFSPLSPASPVSPLSPRGPWGPWKGRRRRVRLRVADPCPMCPRTLCITRGMPRRAQHHSPACLERQQDRRDPWDLVHPREREEGSQKGPGTGGARGCPVPWGCPNQPCGAALLTAPGIGSCWCRTASLNTLSRSIRAK